MSAAADIRRQANEDRFHERFPSVWSRLETLERPSSTVVEDGGEAVNIRLGEGLLYAEPEPRWSQIQMEAFRTDPDRIGFPDPNHCNLSPVSIGLHADLIAYLQEHDLAPRMAPLPVVDIGYVFVFGVGLGRHLADLVAETPARHIILIEPVAEFLHHALAAIDWTALLEAADARDIKLHCVVEEDPQAIVSAIERILMQEGNTFLDGSFFSPHYFSWPLQETYRLLRERLRQIFLSSGFFEDEIEMVRNCVENLDRYSFRKLGPRGHRQQNLPVFILGAGPSIDNDFPVIRKWREKVLVISCGTSLGILLKNGIRPDLHCEVERGALTHDILKGVADEHGLQGITLVASSTVDPRVGALFDDRWFFFRIGLSPTQLLEEHVVPLPGVDPLVCNTAFSTAAHLGFQDIYLFGIDLAQKQTGRHHARDSVYYKDGNEQYDQLYRKRFDRTVPGNFGGTVETFWAFDLGRHALSFVQRLKKTNLVNCSDGARIDGATPKVAAGIRLPDVLPPRRRVLQAIAERLKSYAPGELLADMALDRHADAARRFGNAFDALIEAAREEDEGFVELEARARRYVGDNRDDYRGVLALAFGSMASMLRLGAFFAARIPDEGDRRAFFHHFLDRYAIHCRAMADRAAEIFDSVGADRDARASAERLRAQA